MFSPNVYETAHKARCKTDSFFAQLFLNFFFFFLHTIQLNMIKFKTGLFDK